MSKCDTCTHNDEPWSESPCEKCRVKFEGEPFKLYEARRVTNYDKVRATSVEELAECFHDLEISGAVHQGARTIRWWIDWLKQEAKEAEPP